MTKNTIILKDRTKIRNEFVAAAGIVPGQVLALDSAGKVALAAGTDYLHMVALEDELQGKGIDDAYASGAQVNAGTFREGDELYMQLAAGQTVAKGDVLYAASGNLTKASGTGNCLFIATEAVTTVGSVGRIAVVVANGAITIA